MSLTVTTKPDAKPTTVHRPVDWQLTTTRTGVQSYSITNIADNGSGFTRYTIGTHAVQTIDTILGAGISDAAFNITQKVTAIAATTIDTDLAFSGSPTGGTITRANTGVNIRAELLAFNGDILEIDGIVNNSGAPKITFASAHGFTVNTIFKLNNTNIPSYDIALDIGEFTIDSTTEITLNNVTFVSPTPPTSGGIHSTGGSDNSAYVIAASTLMKKNGLNIGNTFFFDFSKEMSTLLTGDLVAALWVIGARPTAYNSVSDASTSYTVRWTEVLDVDGLQTDSATIFEDNSSNDWYSLVNGIRQHTEDQDFDDYTVNIATTGTVKFLTDAPRGKIIVGNSTNTVPSLQLAVYVDGLESMQVQMEPFGLGGASLGVLTALINLRAKEGLFSLGVSDLASSGVIFDSTVKFVDIWLEDTATTTQQTEKLRVTVDIVSCPGTEIQFLNKYGVWDKFIFKGALNSALSTDRSSYTKTLGTSFATVDRGESSLGIEANDTFTLFSGGLSIGQMEWLKQLMLSSEVFLKDGTDTIPIIVTNKSQVISKGRDMPEIVLNYRLANSLITHG